MCHLARNTKSPKIHQAFPPSKQSNAQTSAPWTVLASLSVSAPGSRWQRPWSNTHNSPVVVEVSRCAGEAQNAAVDFCPVEETHLYLVNTKRKKHREEQLVLVVTTTKKSRHFPWCRPFFWFPLFGINHTTLPNLGLTDDFVRSGINGLNTWDRAENCAKPCRAIWPGLFRLQTQILCVARNSLGFPDFKSSRVKALLREETNKHNGSCSSCSSCWSLWWVEVFLGIEIWKVGKHCERASATMTCNSSQFSDAKPEVLLSIYRGHIHLGCMVLPSLQSIWFVYPLCFLLSKTPWNENGCS